MLELRFSDTRSHRRCGGDTAGDRLEEVVDVVSARPLRGARISRSVNFALSLHLGNLTHLLMSKHVATDLALALLNEADVCLHAVLQVRPKIERSTVLSLDNESNLNEPERSPWQRGPRCMRSSASRRAERAMCGVQ